MKIATPRMSIVLTALVVVGAAAIALITILSGAGPSAPQRCAGTLVPAYRGPEALAQLAGPGRGRVVIVNPASGPGTAAQPAYRRAIEAQARAGATVVGYVHTGYATRDPAAVMADIRRYRAWYGIDGVFLDEVGHTAQQLPYYRAIAAPLRASGATVVLNPGAVPARGYFRLANIVVTFEGPVEGYAAAVRRMPGWVRALPRARIAHLVYGASETQAMHAANLRAAGFFYATSGTLPDPWGTVPPYLADLERRTGACS